MGLEPIAVALNQCVKMVACTCTACTLAHCTLHTGTLHTGTVEIGYGEVTDRLRKAYG